MNKRELGTLYEKRAASYLEEHGYRVKAQNYRCRTGEIDLIAEEDGCLCFVEVKYRSGARFGAASEAVDARKQHTIIMTARYYLQQQGYCDETPCRFDVVAFDGERIELIRNAFEIV